MSFPTGRIVYKFGDFVLDPASETLRTADGARVALRAKSFALLKLLVENAGQLLTRAAIMDALWPNIFVTDDSITQCIRDIRLAVGRDATVMLQTVRRRGYVFRNGAVSKDQAQAGDAAHVPRAEGSAGRGTGRPVRLLVLPLKSNSHGASGAHRRFAESATEVIVAEVADVLRVLAAGAVQVQFRDDRLAHRQAATARSRPDYVLRGSITGGCHGTLSLQLIEAASCVCIWAEQGRLCWRREKLARLIRAVSIALVDHIRRPFDGMPTRAFMRHDLPIRGHRRLASSFIPPR